MTSIVVKGYFTVQTSNNSRIQIGVNHNGRPDWLAANPADAVITQLDSTGSVAAEDLSGVSQTQSDVCDALDHMYERRRVAWVKMTFIPKYTNYIQAVTDEGNETLSGFTNEIVYVCSDMNGLNGVATNPPTAPITSLLANNTGVKLKKLNRRFKVFRKSRKFPFAPKYLQANAEQFSDVNAEVFAAGAWNLATDNSPSSYRDHTWIITDTLPMAPGVELFTCVFEIKYVWADRRSIFTI